MIPKLEKISSAISSSIAVKREVTPYMDYPLHYHPEYEITLWMFMSYILGKMHWERTPLFWKVKKGNCNAD